MNNSLISLAFLSESTLTVLLTELIDESRDLNDALLKGLSNTGSKLNNWEGDSCLEAAVEILLESKNDGWYGLIWDFSSSSRALSEANNSCFLAASKAISLGGLELKKKINKWIHIRNKLEHVQALQA